MTHHIGNLVKQVKSGLIIHQVNCQGVMGSGIAKELREAYPVVWEEYASLCFRRTPSALLGMSQVVQVAPGLWVANLFGQLNYGRDGHRYTSYDALDEALMSLEGQVHHELGVKDTDIHHPRVGCGLGGGSWPVVEALIVTHLGVHTNLWTLD